MASKQPSGLNRKVNVTLWQLWGFVTVFIIFGLVVLATTYASGSSSISPVASTASDGQYHYGQGVQFNWATKYTNNTGNSYYNPKTEVICYSNGKIVWWADYTEQVSPTQPVTLGSSGNGYNAPGPGNWYYSSNWQTPSSANCTATLFRFGNNAKFMTLAQTTFNVVNP